LVKSIVKNWFAQSFKQVFIIYLFQNSFFPHDSPQQGQMLCEYTFVKC